MANIDGPLLGTAVAVNLPTTAVNAGVAQVGFVRDAAQARIKKVSEEGGGYDAVEGIIFDCSFNGAAAGALFNNQWNQQATTLTTALNGGFLRFNNGAVTTINTGVSINTWSTFNIKSGQALRIKAFIRHTQGAVSNKVFEWGLGYYDVAANQAAATNEFIGFRWTSAGALHGVVEYSTGGAPTSTTTTLSVQSDSVARQYEIVITRSAAEFWIAGVYVGQIALPADAPGVSKANGSPLMARLYHTGSAPASAPVFDVGAVTIMRTGPDTDISRPIQQSFQGRHLVHNQAGIAAASGSTSVTPASGTAPTGVTATNTTSALVGLGGAVALNGAAITATVHSEFILNSFQVPAIPETAGQATDARSLVITDLMISPAVVTTVLVGGGFVTGYLIAIGSTALSLATADAIGGAAIGTKSPRRIWLPMTDTLAAAAAVGTVATRNGQSAISFQTPLVVHPGEFVVVAMRTMQVTALVSSGVIGINIGYSGYWE